jgi:hypothetical protein
MSKAPVITRITDRQALEITRVDPEPNADGTCIVCRKPRNPERSRAYAGITATLDPFCSNPCARTWYGNPLPTSALEEVAGAQDTPRSASTEAGTTLPRVERVAASSSVGFDSAYDELLALLEEHEEAA